MAQVRKHHPNLEKYRTGVRNKVKHEMPSRDFTNYSSNSSECESEMPFELTFLDACTDFTEVDPMQGSINLTVISPDFDHLLTLLQRWINQRPHNQVCQLMKRIVHHCSSRHLQMLTTVIQPVQSRSFVYTARLSSRSCQSSSISNSVMTKAKLRAKRLPSLNVDKRSNRNGVKTPKKVEPEDSDTQRIFTFPASKITKISTTSKITHPSSCHNISTYNETLHILKHTAEIEERNAEIENCFLTRECQILIYWFSREWDDVKRVAFLKKLLMSLDSRQMYYLSDLIQGKKHRDFVADLPECLAKRILTYLSPKELSVICQVCTKWRQLASCDDVWKVKCKQTRFTLPKEIIAKRSSWKELYKTNKNLQANWVGGFCQTLELKGHTDKVLTLAVNADRVASGSSDKTVRVWCIHTGHLQQTFYGHQRGVWCVCFFTNNVVISGSYDTTIRIWNIRMGGLVRTLISHRGPVWVIVCQNDLLLTTSQDKTAKIWQVSKPQLKYTLTGHTGAIFAGDLAESGELAVTGSTDKSVRLWDTRTGICSQVIHMKHPEPILAISYSNGFIACAQGVTVTVFHSITTQLIAMYNEHKDRVETVQLRIFTDKYQHPFQGLPKNIVKDVGCQGMVISGGKDGLVKFWDISQWPCSVHTFNERRCKVNCAQFDDLRIVSVSYNHRIVIRDFGYSLSQNKTNGKKRYLHSRRAASKS